MQHQQQQPPSPAHILNDIHFLARCKEKKTSTMTTCTTVSQPTKPCIVEPTSYKLYRIDSCGHLRQTPSQDETEEQQADRNNTKNDELTEQSVEAYVLQEQYRSELCDRKSKFGGRCPYHPLIAESYTKMGLLYQHMLQDPKRALKYHKKALQTLRKCQDEVTNNTDCTCNKCTSSTDDEQDEHDQLKLVQRCAIDIATTLADIGHVQRSMERNDEALASYREAVESFDRAGASQYHPARHAAKAGIGLLTCG